ncbi:MAG: energy-coupled thiamine transporter ThiT [Candidatus Izemoplasmataceae bacterium]
MNRNLSTKQITEIAILLAIAVVFELIAMFLPKMPQGGSFSLSMLPIFIIAFRQGPKIGIIAGVTYGLLDLMLNGFILWHPMSFFLDYVIAFGLLGVSGFIFKINKNSLTLFITGIIIGSTLRFFSHFLAGILLFKESLVENYPDMPIALGSIIYNMTYMLPSMVITVIVGAIIYLTLKTQLLESNQAL